MNKTCILVVGPTAAGKTALSIQLAQHFSTEIISCDSRQCYKELNIGVAKPSSEELALVPHHFINSHSVHETVNAASFESYALEKADEIFAKHDIVVMAGGTGLYAKAFCEGMDEIPAVNDIIRLNINGLYQQHGLHWLQEEIKKNDPRYFANAEIKNPHRLLRALEVKLSTGRSILDFQTKEKKARDFDIIKIGIEIPRADLNNRIDKRVDMMMHQGLLAEVKSLLPYKHLNALQTVGYKELFGYLENKISLQEAIHAIKTNTRQYAKRQMTWFRKDETIFWCAPVFDKILMKVNDRLTYQK